MSLQTNGQLRPRDLANLLLASGDLLPRQRARDQRADLVGNNLKQRLLERLVELNPEPVELKETLDRIVHELGEPYGPTRAMAIAVLEEFDAASGNPKLVAWLIEQETRSPNGAPGPETADC